MWSKNPYCATACASCNACKGNKRQIRSNFLGKGANWLGTPAYPSHIIECPLTWPLDRSILKRYGPGIIRLQWLQCFGTNPATKMQSDFQLFSFKCLQITFAPNSLLFTFRTKLFQWQLLPPIHPWFELWSLHRGTNFKLLFLMLSVWPSRVPAS